MKKMILAAIATGMIASATTIPAQAQSTLDAAPRTIVVDYSDLDFSDESHMGTLRDRVDHAIRKLCPARIERGVKVLPNHRVCRARTWESVEPALAKIEGDKGTRLAVTVPSPNGG